MSPMQGYGTRWMNQVFADPSSAHMTVAQQDQIRFTARRLDQAEETRALDAAQRHDHDNEAFVQSSMDFGNQAIEEALRLGTAIELDTITGTEAAKGLERLDKALDSLRLRRDQVAKTEALTQMIRDDPHAHQERLAQKYPQLADNRVQRGLNGG